MAGPIVPFVLRSCASVDGSIQRIAGTQDPDPRPPDLYILNQSKDAAILYSWINLWDVKTQAAKADKLINGSTPVLITDVVLVETLWTLKGKKYKLDKTAMIDVLNSLLEEHNYRQAKSVKTGNKKKEADFADALIVNKAKFYAMEKAKRSTGFILLTSLHK